MTLPPAKCSIHIYSQLVISFDWFVKSRWMVLGNFGSCRKLATVELQGATEQPELGATCLRHPHPPTPHSPLALPIKVDLSSPPQPLISRYRSWRIKAFRKEEIWEISLWVFEPWASSAKANPYQACLDQFVIFGVSTLISLILHFLTLIQETVSRKEHGTSHVALPWAQSWHQPIQDDLMLWIGDSGMQTPSTLKNSHWSKIFSGYNTDHALQVVHNILPHAHPDQVAVRFLVRRHSLSPRSNS